MRIIDYNVVHWPDCSVSLTLFKLLCQPIERKVVSHFANDPRSDQGQTPDWYRILHN